MLRVSRAWLHAAPSGRMDLLKAREVLGVTLGVSRSELKQAFRENALRWHPDLNPAAEARGRFLECRAAFEALHSVLGGRGGGAAGGDEPGANQPQYADSSVYAGRPRPPDPWGEKEQPRDWQERVQEAHRRSRLEHLKAEAERAETMSLASARRLGLKRGKLLVATPQMRGFFSMAVVLVMEVEDGFVRGIVVNGGPGGRTGLTDNTIFHSCAAVASDLGHPVVDGVELFAEDYLSKDQAQALAEHLGNLDEPLARTQGYTWWRLEQLVTEIEGGQWTTLDWGTEGARWWLKVRSKLTTRTLWRRALERLDRAGL